MQNFIKVLLLSTVLVSGQLRADMVTCDDGDPSCSVHLNERAPGKKPSDGSNSGNSSNNNTGNSSNSNVSAGGAGDRAGDHVGGMELPPNHGSTGGSGSASPSNSSSSGGTASSTGGSSTPSTSPSSTPSTGGSSTSSSSSGGGASLYVGGDMVNEYRAYDGATITRQPDGTFNYTLGDTVRNGVSGDDIMSWYRNPSSDFSEFLGGGSSSSTSAGGSTPSTGGSSTPSTSPSSTPSTRGSSTPSTSPSSTPSTGGSSTPSTSFSESGGVVHPIINDGSAATFTLPDGTVATGTGTGLYTIETPQGSLIVDDLNLYSRYPELKNDPSFQAFSTENLSSSEAPIVPADTIGLDRFEIPEPSIPAPDGTGGYQPANVNLEDVPQYNLDDFSDTSIGADGGALDERGNVILPDTGGAMLDERGNVILPGSEAGDAIGAIGGLGSIDFGNPSTDWQIGTEGTIDFMQPDGSVVTGNIDAAGNVTVDGLPVGVMDEGGFRADPSLDPGAAAGEGAGVTDRGKSPVENKDIDPKKDAKENVAFNEGIGVDILRIATQILSSLEADKDLTIREDVIIKAAEIGAAVGALDETALAGAAEGLDEGGSGASSIMGATALTQQLLEQASVDLSLLDDSKVSGANGATLTPDAKQKEIKKRRMQLLAQCAGAAVQVAEGMNAISNKFVDRANILVARAMGISTETNAYGAVNDAGRFVMFETLRGLALSATQMSVLAARILSDQDVEVEEAKDDNK